MFPKFCSEMGLDHRVTCAREAQSSKRQDKVATIMNDSTTSTHLLRSQHVKALRSFVSQSRHDMLSFPDHIKSTVCAILDLEKVKHQDEVNKLQMENESLKRHVDELTNKLAQVKDGLRKAIATLKDRDKLIARLQPS